MVMVMVNNKLAAVKSFRDLLEARLALKKGKNGKGLKQFRKGIRSKLSILSFYEKNGHWPNRKSDNLRERVLGYRFENYVSKKAGSFDLEFRELVMSAGRTTNNKRPHNVKGFKEQILAFIQEKGHAPRRFRHAADKVEANLAAKLDYYVRIRGDMTFLGKVYEGDQCHKSGIPTRFRPILNKELDLEKPLVRLVK